jgi:hypothetical protein
LVWSLRTTYVPNFPIEAKQIQIDCNRKRGRSRKTKPALKYQDEIEHFFLNTDSESEATVAIVKSKTVKRKKPNEFEDDDEEYDLYADIPQKSKTTTIGPSTSSTVQPSTSSITIQRVSKKPNTATALVVVAIESQKSIFKEKIQLQNVVTPKEVAKIQKYNFFYFFFYFFY